MPETWQRYQRQLGLVYQQHVARLRVLFVGDDPALTFLVSNCALLGIGAEQDGQLLLLRHERSPTVTTADLSAQCLLRILDYGEPYEEQMRLRIGDLNPDVRSAFVDRDALGATPDVVIVLGDGTWDGPGTHVIYGRTGRVAIAMGQRPAYLRAVGAQTAHYTVLTTALASVLGARIAQEILRVSGAMRPYPIERFWLSGNIRLAAGTEPAQPPGFTIGGSMIAGVPSQADQNELFDRAQGAVYRAVLPFEHDLTRLLWAATTLDIPSAGNGHRAHEQLTYSPFTRWRAPQTRDEGDIAPDGYNVPDLPAHLADAHIVIGGAGGLGSWLLTTLAASPVLNTRLTVIESDPAVEVHNLNRQILYQRRDVGKPKALAIARALTERNRTLTVDVDATYITATHAPALQTRLRDAQLVCTTFDTFAARYLLGMCAAAVGVPLVNGGALTWQGDAELLHPATEGCIMCCWEGEEDPGRAAAHRSDAAHQSCSREDENAGQIGTAIVTTNALVGSLLALLALATLSMPTLPKADIDHKIGVNAADNLIIPCRVAQFAAMPQCPIHRRSALHDEHLKQFAAPAVQ